MQARRAARELGLILFSQFDENIKKYKEKDFEDIILKSVRTLTNNASEELKITVGALFDIKEFIEDYEANHETNLKRHIDAKDLPVPIPMTSDMIGRLDELINVAEKAMVALEVAEMATLEEKSDVKTYTMEIAKNYQENKEEIDSQIKEFSIGWDFSRLVKMDKDILRIAICELLYVQQSPYKVVIDEAVELAKKYSTEDSASFVNGILGKIVEKNGLKKKAK
ncbi:transcription antitermination factor NusB [bacterium]|nr:transcription antitermination factor NusB [bacterium]